MKELIDGYVKRVRELAEHVRGNEQATKQSLVGPLFTLLGYDLTDPRECVPEFRAEFGKDRSVKPVDWAFVQNGRPLFFVEAKEASRKLVGYDEQLADYFAKAPEAKLGILTNGIQWRFFTDVNHENVMDVEPFLKWDVFSEENPPLDFLTLLQKSQFNPQLIRTFAKQRRNQNLLLNEISRLLEPSADFVRLAVSNLETRKLTENVVESWKPVLAAALQEWVKQTMLSLAIDFGTRTDLQQETASRIETTPEELEGFATVQRLLGPDRPIAYEDTISYFKIHLKERYTWVMCRFYFGRKRPTIWVPLAIEDAGLLASQFPMMTPQQGWTCLSLDSPKDLESVGDLLRKAYDQQRANRVKGSDGAETVDPSKKGPVSSVSNDSV
jgi:predicted type IV restriction endonuclease